MPPPVAHNNSPLSHSAVDLPPIRSQQGKEAPLEGPGDGLAVLATAATADKVSDNHEPMEVSEVPSQAPVIPSQASGPITGENKA